MLIDLIGASLFFAAGVIVGINYQSGVLLKKPIKRHATRDEDQFLYGKHKMEWFWRREMEEDERKRCLPLRTYAKMHSET